MRCRSPRTRRRLLELRLTRRDSSHLIRRRKGIKADETSACPPTALCRTQADSIRVVMATPCLALSTSRLALTPVPTIGTDAHSPEALNSVLLDISGHQCLQDLQRSFGAYGFLWWRQPNVHGKAMWYLSHIGCLSCCYRNGVLVYHSLA